MSTSESLSAVTCRWDWCMQTFADSSSLRAHVEEDHIANAVPIKKKDVPLLRRAEDGASLQESILPRAWIFDNDGSKSHTTSTRIERAVMTEPALVTSHASMTSNSCQSPMQMSPPRPDAPIKSSTPRSQPKENVQQISFSALRGTPDPTPSPIPSSPGISAIIGKMKQNINAPIRSSHAAPLRTLYSKPSSKANPSKATPKTRSLRPYTFLTPPLGDHSGDEGSMRVENAADPDASMDFIESQLQSVDDQGSAMDVNVSIQNFLPSQWQPQSQLPLSESFENSSQIRVSTINPDQLHAPLSDMATSRSMFETHLAGILSPSRKITLDDAKGSRNPETPRPSSSQRPPPSTSTMDISNKTATESQENVSRTPKRRVSPSQPSSVAGVSSATSPSDAMRSAFGDKETDSFARGMPFDLGFGYGYSNESQPLLTQVPLPQNSFDSSGWDEE